MKGMLVWLAYNAEELKLEKWRESFYFERDVFGVGSVKGTWLSAHEMQTIMKRFLELLDEEFSA